MGIAKKASWIGACKVGLEDEPYVAEENRELAEASPEYPHSQEIALCQRRISVWSRGGRPQPGGNRHFRENQPCHRLLPLFEPGRGKSTTRRSLEILSCLRPST